MTLSPLEPPPGPYTHAGRSIQGRQPPPAPQSRSGYQRAWRLAWWLHVWLLGGGLVASWVYQKCCQAPSPVHVFELYAPEKHSMAPGSARAKPAPARTPKATPQPKTPPAPPKAVPKKAPPPERLSYASFRAKHAKPQAPASVATAPSSSGQTARSPLQPSAATPRLDPHALALGLQTQSLHDPDTTGSAVRQPGHSGGTQDPLALYISTLKQALEALWIKPQAVPAHAQAQVSFTLSASGALVAFKITHSSGHAAFDASVAQVFQSAPVLPAPPAGQACTFVLTFKATDP